MSGSPWAMPGATLADNTWTSVPPSNWGERDFFDDFTTPVLDSTKWSKFNGRVGSYSKLGWYNSGNVVPDPVDSSVKLLANYVSAAKSPTGAATILTAGIEAKFDALRGLTLVAFKRSDNGGGPPADVSCMHILYPKGGGWPPEVDTSEDGGQIDNVSATIHWGNGSDPRQRDQVRFVGETVPGSLASWHVWGLEWLPTAGPLHQPGPVYEDQMNLTIRTNGDAAMRSWCDFNTQGGLQPPSVYPQHGLMCSFRELLYGDQLPGVPMHSILQNVFAGSAAPPGSESSDSLDLQIDWIVHYPYVGPN